MPEATSAAKTQAEIPQSVLEYTLVFASPIIQVGEARTVLVMAALDALKPWGFALDGVETRLRSDKLSEHAIIFRRTKPAAPSMSLTLFYDKIFISAENLDWDSADDFIRAASAGVEAVKSASNPTVKAQHLVVGIHIQLKDRQRAEVVKPLLSREALRLIDGDLKFPGVIVTGDKLNVIIEASLVYANGLWVRLFREHPGNVTLQELAAVLRTDEERLFEVLGLEGVL
jgi:hypothetical protein